MNTNFFDLQINGAPFRVSAPADKPLLWVLRDELKLKGTKYGCGVGVCGICMVLLDDEPHHACMVRVRDVGSRAITTIEGLATVDSALMNAWIDAQVPQCGYCQPGQLMAACALRRAHSSPTVEHVELAMSGVLCRCGTYQRIRRAIENVGAASAQPPPESNAHPPPDEGIELDPFLRIHADGTVTLQINHSEMGQGALSAMVMLAAEELEIDPQQIRTEFAPADPVYKNPLWGSQFTGGSSTVRGEWTAIRQRAANVRARLIEAAARRWRVPAEQCRAELGRIVSMATGQSLGYAELASDATRIASQRDVSLKTKNQFRVVGHAMPRPDVPDMVTGQTEYAIDLEIPNLRVAVIERCPFFGGEVSRVDDAAARAVEGVSDVQIIDAGVAVVADSFWNAMRGRSVLKVEWNTHGNPHVDTSALYAALEQASHAKGKLVKEHGNARRSIESGTRVVRADYQTPYIAHVTMEPPNCIAWVQPDGCDVWVGTQSQVEAHAVAARTSGLPRAKVRIHTQFMGGGFGRRLEADFIAEAVQLSKRIGTPVQTIFTRGDDLQHGFYRPNGHVRLEGALDATGNANAWWMRVAGCDMALDGTKVPYTIQNFREEHCEVDSPLPVGAWRSVGASQHCFAIESFMDELAHAAGADPIEFRLAHLQNEPRLRGVLETVRETANWRTNVSPGIGYGVAIFRGFGSDCAIVAEVDANHPRKVTRITCVLDCGFAVNPDIVHAQVEGGILLALSATLHEEIKVESGRVTQATFLDYPILKFSEAPEIVVRLITDAATPGGAGEPPIPPLAPAVANAWFHATGERRRQLPLFGTSSSSLKD